MVTFCDFCDEDALEPMWGSGLLSFTAGKTNQKFDFCKDCGRELLALIKKTQKERLGCEKPEPEDIVQVLSKTEEDPLKENLNIPTGPLICVGCNREISLEELTYYASGFYCGGCYKE